MSVKIAVTMTTGRVNTFNVPEDVSESLLREMCSGIGYYDLQGDKGRVVLSKNQIVQVDIDQVVKTIIE